MDSLPGALVFVEIEKPHEDDLYQEKLDKSKEVDAAIDYLKKIFWHYANNEARYNYTQEQFSERVKSDLETLKNFVIQYHSDYGYDMTEDWDYSWTFPKALLFTVTIMTTIGYGHIYPLTFAGKLFTIFYAMIGMPLLILFMKDIGDSMAKGVRYAYRYSMPTLGSVCTT